MVNIQLRKLGTSSQKRVDRSNFFQILLTLERNEVRQISYDRI